MVRYETHFDKINHVVVAHQCMWQTDRQTDGQTHRMTFSNSAVCLTSLDAR